MVHLSTLAEFFQESNQNIVNLICTKSQFQNFKILKQKKNSNKIKLRDQVILGGHPQASRLEKLFQVPKFKAIFFKFQVIISQILGHFHSKIDNKQDFLGAKCSILMSIQHRVRRIFLGGGLNLGKTRVGKIGFSQGFPT